MVFCLRLSNETVTLFQLTTKSN